MLAFYSLGAHAPDRHATLGLLAGIAGMWAGVLASGEVDVQSFVFSAGLVGLAPWLAGRANRARRLRAEALDRERDQRARAAASEERQRIARELHDVVAHGVVLMVLQAQGARRILDHDPTARARRSRRSRRPARPRSRRSGARSGSCATSTRAPSSRRSGASTTSARWSTRCARPG